MELFNIREDIGETNNLVHQRPVKTRQMAKLLSDYLRKVKAQIPSDKNTAEKVAYPDEVLSKEGKPL